MKYTEELGDEWVSCILYHLARDIQTWPPLTWWDNSLWCTTTMIMCQNFVETFTVAHLFTHSAIYQIDPIEKVHNMHSQPVIEILSFWQLDNLSQIDT